MAENLRTVSLHRQGSGRYVATNVRGGTITIGSGADDDFTPVELLLAAIAGCSAVDVDLITGKRSEPEIFAATASGNKINDSLGNRLTDLLLDFDISFPTTRAAGRRPTSWSGRSGSPTTGSARSAGRSRPVRRSRPHCRVGRSRSNPGRPKPRSGWRDG